MNVEEYGSIKLLKLKYRKGDQIIQTFCKTGSPQEISSPFFNLYKFEKPEASAPASYKIIQTFCKIGSPQKLRPRSLIWGNFRAITKVLLNDAEYIEVQ